MIVPKKIVKLKNKSGDQKPQKKRRVFRKALRVGTKFKFKKMKNVMTIFGAIILIAICLSACSGCTPSACECKSVMEIKAINGSLNFDDQKVYNACDKSYSDYKRECNNE